ncbi:MAG: response regulator [Spirochaetia bacterium]|jgi:two-component system response regulator YesN
MMRVLIADDEALIRERLKKIIARSGLEIEIVGEASTGQEALTLALEKKPALVIVDIEMPVLGGLQFLSAARDAGLSLKALVLTGFAQFEYARKALQLGVIDYLMKPVSELALVDALRRVVRETAARLDE